MKRNIKLVLEYDGTAFHGWQTQAGSGKQTIQETIERAVMNLTGEHSDLYSSGRTDSGVHALGHVANFHTTSAIPAAAWAPALNHLLPGDIRILASEEMSSDFHARYSAISKTYRYRILNRPAPTALYRHRAWHINRILNVGAMEQGARVLVGTHDFSAFRGSGCTAKSTIRTVFSLEIAVDGDFIDITVEANGFLQYMVRNITGTLVETGLGRFSPDDLIFILASRDRKKAGRTAPSHGLYLIQVSYSS